MGSVRLTKTAPFVEQLLASDVGKVCRFMQRGLTTPGHGSLTSLEPRINANRRGLNDRVPCVLRARKIDYSLSRIQLLTDDVASPG